MAAFFLRGARYLIAALQPVSDFYMPLLTCLFYQSWHRLGGHPAQALAEAKRRLKTGDWYPDTEDLLRTAYRPVLEGWLAQLADNNDDTGLAIITWSWGFPTRYQALDPDHDQDKLEDLKEEIRDATKRHALLTDILDRLCRDRRSAAIDHLCTWVRGFGSIE
jgi:hypothetical protein